MLDETLHIRLSLYNKKNFQCLTIRNNIQNNRKIYDKKKWGKIPSIVTSLLLLKISEVGSTQTNILPI